ncbi:MAG: ribonuclease R [Rikenellaceae bacterium]
MTRKEKVKEKEATQLISRDELKHLLFCLFERNPQQTYNFKQAASRVGVSGSEAKELLQELLYELKSEKVIEKIDRSNYQFTRAQLHRLTGRVDMTASGMAFIVVEGAEPTDKDIIVESRNLHHAMHDDIVEVVIIARRRDGRAEGEVVEIIQKTKRIFVGRIDIREDRSYGFVIVDSRKVPTDIMVPQRYWNGAVDGQKVLVEITVWDEGAKNPTGRVVDILGNVGDNNTEMHSILAEYDLPYHFPEDLEEIAEDIPSDLTPEEFSKRRDMRGVTTLTIDPADAKDFDDALSIQRLENGNWEIGVHIADVTHYVRPCDPIDTEAIERATSVYLVDRTIPMLPERLSNNLCSLRPNEEKLAFSAIFEMTDDAKIVGEWFGRTVIYSDKRFTYEEAQAVIEGGESSLREEVLTLDRLAKILRKARFKSGSIGFERDEAKFILDENGKPEGVYFKEMKDSNQLIEEFMLLANQKVATFIGKSDRTFIYRVHDTPNEEKFEKFRSFVTRFGFNLRAERGKAVAKELTALLQDVKNTPEENLISTLAIRSMAKATYTTTNIGHYGLAFDYYSHFTSPIRRYPDMMVHRLLQHYLEGGKSVDPVPYDQLCKHSSTMEIKASEAERSSIKYKMVEYMEDKLGQQFDGVISGVADWGIYVELDDTKIEGMVALRDMHDDFYAFDGENYAAIGQTSGREFRLGDSVRIEIKRADLQRKQLDFIMLGMVDFHTKEFTPLPQKEKKQSEENLEYKPKERKKKGSRSGKKRERKKR